MKKNTQTYASGVTSKTSRQALTQKKPRVSGSRWDAEHLKTMCTAHACLDNLAIERFAISTRHVLINDHEAELETQPCLPLLGLKTTSGSVRYFQIPYDSHRKIPIPCASLSGDWSRAPKTGENILLAPNSVTRRFLFCSACGGGIFYYKGKLYSKL